MRKVVVQEFISLDGVAQAPGAPDEDTTGGFIHGGWHLGYLDDAAREWILACLTGAGGYLLGRRTYEIFAGYWPKAPEEERAVAEPLNTRPKYVASTSLTEPLSWQHSTLLKGGLAEAVPALKHEDGGPLLVIGSTALVHGLLAHDLVDEVQVMIDPVLLGGGKRAFPDDGVRRPLRLVDSQVTGTGAIIATYVPSA
jgi:dihydrofolate reductase